MPNQPKSFNRTIRLDPQLAADADEKARRQGTTLSAVIRMLLTEWVYEDEPDQIACWHANISAGFSGFRRVARSRSEQPESVGFS